MYSVKFFESCFFCWVGVVGLKRVEGEEEEEVFLEGEGGGE